MSTKILFNNTFLPSKSEFKQLKRALVLQQQKRLGFLMIETKLLQRIEGYPLPGTYNDYLEFFHMKV